MIAALSQKIRALALWASSFRVGKRPKVASGFRLLPSIGGILKFFLAALLLASCISLFRGLLTPVLESQAHRLAHPDVVLPGPDETFWEGDLGDVEDRVKNPISNPTLNIKVRSGADDIESVSATYELDLPKSHPVVNAARGVENKDTEQFVAAVLGRIKVNGSVVRFTSPEVEIDEANPNAHLRFSGSTRYIGKEQVRVEVLTPGWDRPFLAGTGKVNINNGEVRVIDSPAPRAEAQGITVLDRDLNHKLEFVLDFPIAMSDETSDSDSPSPREEKPGNWDAVKDQLQLTAFGMVAMIPALLVLVWLIHYGKELGLERVRIGSLCSVILLMQSSEFGVSLLNEITLRTGTIPARLEIWMMQGAVSPYRFYDTGAYVVILGLAACAWPLLMRAWRYPVLARHLGSSWWTRIRWITGTIVLLGLSFSGVIAAAYYWDSRPNPGLDAQIVNLIPALPLLFLASMLLLGALGLRGRILRSALVMTALVVLLTALELFTNADSDSPLSSLPNKWIADAVIFLLCGAPLLLAISRFLVRLWIGRPTPASYARFQYAIAVPAVLMLPFLAAADPNQPQGIDIWNFMRALARFAIFFLLGMMIRWMRDRAPGASWPRCSEPTLAAGMVLALAFLYSTGSWNQVAVQLATGYVMIRYVLFVYPQLPDAPEPDLRARAGVVARWIRWNELQRVARSLKKEILSKISKGETPYTDYGKWMDPVELDLAEAAREMADSEAHIKDTVLAYGPTESAWRNAQISSAWGLLFTIPWIVLSLRDVINTRSSLGTGWMPTLNSALNITMRWLILVFLFGYFYAYIRGRSGMRKAFWGFIAVVTPSALTTALFSHQWGGFFFWAFQVLMTAMLVGLTAGDYETLRRCGCHWRDLISVHNAGALSASASTLVLALGTIATTMAKMDVGALVKAALQYAGVIPKSPN